MMASPCTVIGGKVERAYRRGDLFDKRRKLMEGGPPVARPEGREGRGVQAIGERTAIAA
jgi:hypothetical protein